MLKSENVLLCMTETQQKIDKIHKSDNTVKIENMRLGKDRKGGGLMMIYKESKTINLQKIETQNKDILHVNP